MKVLIEFGITIILTAVLAKNLPFIIRKVHEGQIEVLKGSTSTKWGKPWIPKGTW